MSWVHLLAQRIGAQLVETHISWVLLTDTEAFKIKKPVRLPFVDYASPARRRHFCAEEVRLNRRLAAPLYLGLVRITGTRQVPEIEGPGPTLEYAVRMRRFPAGALFSEMAADGRLQAWHADALARLLARFHEAIPWAGSAAQGQGSEPLQRAQAALAGARTLFSAAEHAELQGWLHDGAQVLAPVWAARRAAGCVRECHGDLHLANIVEMEGQVWAFDGIEFDASLRWIDVIEDVAFALMDFVAQGQSGLGWRFLNGWLERTGDYAGCAALRYALVYRALVRAQVEHLRDPRGPQAVRHARTALLFARPARPRLCITHGLPGSGKTRASQAWLEQAGAIRIRSDVERKRLHGLRPQADSRALGLDIYTREAGERTYRQLLERARGALLAGFPVVLDAAFLQRSERRQAQALAQQLGVPFSILSCSAPLPVLRQRLAARRGDASEADATVLARLAASQQPLAPDELQQVEPG